jgi:hypothetical protein
MAAAHQVELIARALENGSYAGAGIRSAEQWVAWQCGVSLSHARQLVAMARRLPELPVTGAAFGAGELAEDQVAVICRHVPAHNDAEAAELARYATVSQLRRTLGRYGFPPVSPPPAGPHPEPDPEAPAPRRASLSATTGPGACRLCCLPTRGRWWRGRCPGPAPSSSPRRRAKRTGAP